MNTKPAQLRAESHNVIGSVIARDSGTIIERWAQRAIEEQAAAKRVHHDVLLDHLPSFLWELGKSLAEVSTANGFSHCRPAGIHGDQRWEVGWSIEEVVRDYQLLRLVLIAHLDETIERPLTAREMMALGVYVDDAIAASVAAFLASQKAAESSAHGSKNPDAQSGELYGILGLIGHELRNPLAPLGNALELLRLAGSNVSVVERTRLLMERQHRVLVRLVEDLLDLPRIVRGKMHLRSEQFDLVQRVREAVEDRRSTFEEAGIRLQLELPSEPVPTMGDTLRLTQALGNLLGNAVKFTDRGGEVVVGLVHDLTRRLAILTVRDTGIGIEPSVLPGIFDAFIQADRAVERSRSGLGLGLALVKGIVELHGGSIRATSAGQGLGSEFIVELPVIDLHPADEEKTAAQEATVTPRRILVIEDEPDSAESLKMCLELLGHQVSVAHSGPDGLRLAAADPPDLVLCDVGLPGMSGHAVCTEMRKLPAMAKTRIIALSGYSENPGSGETARGDFDHYLVKPVDPSRLDELIREARPKLP